MSTATAQTFAVEQRISSENSQTIGYGRPPRQHCFQPGRSGNPKGRRSAGASLAEHLNSLGEMTEAELRKLFENPGQPALRRAAALQLLHSLECGDLADFEDLMAGRVTMEDMALAGFNTAIVKRFKRKVRTIRHRNGSIETITSVSVELHNRSGAAVDRIMDRTLGRPGVAVHIDLDAEGRYAGFVASADEIREVRALLEGTSRTEVPEIEGVARG
jgi:hypothetical protein